MKQYNIKGIAVVLNINTGAMQLNAQGCRTLNSSTDTYFAIYLPPLIKIVPQMNRTDHCPWNRGVSNSFSRRTLVVLLPATTIFADFSVLFLLGFHSRDFSLKLRTGSTFWSTFLPITCTGRLTPVRTQQTRFRLRLLQNVCTASMTRNLRRHRQQTVKQYSCSANLIKYIKDKN